MYGFGSDLYTGRSTLPGRGGEAGGGWGRLRYEGSNGSMPLRRRLSYVLSLFRPRVAADGIGRLACCDVDAYVPPQNRPRGVDG